MNLERNIIERYRLETPRELSYLFDILSKNSQAFWSSPSESIPYVLNVLMGMDESESFKMWASLISYLDELVTIGKNEEFKKVVSIVFGAFNKNKELSLAFMSNAPKWSDMSLNVGKQQWIIKLFAIWGYLSNKAITEETYGFSIISPHQLYENTSIVLKQSIQVYEEYLWSVFK